MMRTLVLTPCSAKKRSQVLEPALAADLEIPSSGSRSRRDWLTIPCQPPRCTRAGTTAWSWRACRQYGNSGDTSTLDLAILSGGYGVLHADEMIIPYDVTFDQFAGEALSDWGAMLQVPTKAAALVRQYDLVFLLLSGSYLAVLDLPLDVPDSVQQIVLTGQDSMELVPSKPNLHPFVAAGSVAARRWHVKAPHVRGFLFGRLCAQVVQHGPGLLEWLYHHPEDTELLFYKRARWRPQMSLW